MLVSSAPLDEDKGIAYYNARVKAPRCTLFGSDSFGKGTTLSAVPVSFNEARSVGSGPASIMLLDGAGLYNT
jgi:hypothetical protein